MASEEINLADLNGYNGFGFDCLNNVDDCGYSVYGVSDLGDGTLDWLAIGVPAYHDGVGGVYMLKAQGSWRSSLSPEYLNGEIGFIIVGSSEGDKTGYSLNSNIIYQSSNDLLVGAPNAKSTGVVYAINGKFLSGYRGSVLELDGLNTDQVITYYGAENNSQFGFAISSAVYINDDNFADIMISAPEASGGGKIYIFYGSANPTDMYAANLNGENGCVLVQNNAAGNLGYSLGAINYFSPSSSNQYLLIGNPNIAESYIIQASAYSQAVVNINNLASSDLQIISGEAGEQTGYSIVSNHFVDASYDFNYFAAFSAPKASGGGKVYFFTASSSLPFDQYNIIAGSNDVALGESMSAWNEAKYGTFSNAYSLAMSASGAGRVFSFPLVNIYGGKPGSTYNIYQQGDDLDLTIFEGLSLNSPYISLSSGNINDMSSKSSSLSDSLNLFIGSVNETSNEGVVYSYFANPKPSPSPSPQPIVHAHDNTLEIVFGTIGGIVGLSLLCYCLNRFVPAGGANIEYESFEARNQAHTERLRQEYYDRRNLLGIGGHDVSYL